METDDTAALAIGEQLDRLIDERRRENEREIAEMTDMGCDEMMK